MHGGAWVKEVVLITGASLAALRCGDALAQEIINQAAWRRELVTRPGTEMCAAAWDY